MVETGEITEQQFNASKFARILQTDPTLFEDPIFQTLLEKAKMLEYYKHKGEAVTLESFVNSFSLY